MSPYSRRCTIFGLLSQNWHFLILRKIVKPKFARAKILTFRNSVPCVLHHGRVAVQATIAKQVNQDPPPHPEDAVHATEEAAHHPPQPVVLPLQQDAAMMCSTTPPGYHVTYHTLGHRMLQCVLPDAQPKISLRCLLDCF